MSLNSVLQRLTPFHWVLTVLGLIALALVFHFASSMPAPPGPLTPPAVTPGVAAATPLPMASPPSIALTPPLPEPVETAPAFAHLDTSSLEPDTTAIRLRKEAAPPQERFHPEALASLARTRADLHPGTPTPDPFEAETSALLLRGNQLIAGQRWAEALTAYREARQRGYSSPEMALNLAICQDRLGNSEEAAQAYRQVLSVLHAPGSSVAAGPIEARLRELLSP